MGVLLLLAAMLTAGALVSVQAQTNVPAKPTATNVQPRKPAPAKVTRTNAPAQRAVLSPATEPASTNAPLGFQIANGFRLELAASEPLVVAPVAMAFDENGRLFVAEQPARPEGGNAGRIRVLEDREGTGTYTASTVYAEDIPWPSALACYDGGVFVAATPRILYLKDTRRNGISDVRRDVFSGFGGEVETLTSDTLLNSFAWGPDNRIHGITAGIGGKVLAAGTTEGVELGRNDFSFNPRNLDFRIESGPGQSGLAFSAWGDKFVTEHRRPLRRAMYERQDLGRNPFAPAPDPMVEVMSPAARLISLQAQPSAGDQDDRGQRPEPGANLAKSVWFTSARGTVFYQGNAYPTNYLENVFIADPAARVVHRAVLRTEGLVTVALRPPEESEFLASSVPDFYPVQLVNGPDGTLFLADRNTGERGRIYRIVPEKFTQPKVPELSKATTYDLVASLSHPNAWQRETAARLLFERQDPAAIALLTNVVNNSQVAPARIRALHLLASLGALSEAPVTKLLKEKDPRLREQALVLAKQLLRAGATTDGFRQQLQAMAADPAGRVRLQLAFALGQTERPGKAPLLAELVAREPTNLWFRVATLGALDSGAPEMLMFLAKPPPTARFPVFREMLPEMTTMIGTRGRLSDVAQVLEWLNASPPEPVVTYELLCALGEGLRRTRSSLQLLDERGALQKFYTAALNAALDSSTPLPTRAAATRLLGWGPYPLTELAEWLALLLNPQEPPAIQSAAVEAFLHFSDDRAASEVVTRWKFLHPGTRRQAIRLLLSQSIFTPTLLSALESGTVPGGELTSTQLDFLRTYPDPVLSRRAQQLFGPVQYQRGAVMENYKAALNLKGLGSRGREIFIGRCASCHWPAPGKLALAPELASSRTYPKTKLLSSILEPNAEVRTGDKTYVAETQTGEIVAGLLMNENPTTIQLRTADGSVAVVPRMTLQALRAQTWSLMPAGLETGLSAQDVADLLEFVTNPR